MIGTQVNGARHNRFSLAVNRRCQNRLASRVATVRRGNAKFADNAQAACQSASLNAIVVTPACGPDSIDFGLNLCIGNILRDWAGGESLEQFVKPCIRIVAR